MVSSNRRRNLSINPRHCINGPETVQFRREYIRRACVSSHHRLQYAYCANGPRESPCLRSRRKSTPVSSGDSPFTVISRACITSSRTERRAKPRNRVADPPPEVARRRHATPKVSGFHRGRRIGNATRRIREADPVLGSSARSRGCKAPRRRRDHRLKMPRRRYQS